MQTSVAKRAAVFGVVANLVLLALKAGATGLSDSLTIFSETMNSLADSVAAIVILLCVRWAWMNPDASHPFGHRRAEPIAGLLVAIFTCILGFEVAKAGAMNLWQGKEPVNIGFYPMIALCVTGVVKAAMTAYFSRRGAQLRSPALKAAAADCRNDVLVASLGLIGVVVAHYELPMLDTVAGLIVGLYILFSGYRIGLENIDYLMGKSPSDEIIDQIHAAAKRVPGVLEVDGIKAHYVGTFAHVEIVAHVEGSISTIDSHKVAELVRRAVESVDIIDRAFVHISPVLLAADRD